MRARPAALVHKPRGSIRETPRELHVSLLTLHDVRLRAAVERQNQGAQTQGPCMCTGMRRIHRERVTLWQAIQWLRCTHTPVRLGKVDPELCMGVWVSWCVPVCVYGSAAGDARAAGEVPRAAVANPGGSRLKDIAVNRARGVRRGRSGWGKGGGVC